jgi:hypothetical protein
MDEEMRAIMNAYYEKMDAYFDREEANILNAIKTNK